MRLARAGSQPQHDTAAHPRRSEPASTPVPVHQAIPGGLLRPDLPLELAAFDKSLQQRSDRLFQGKGCWGGARYLIVVLETFV